MAAPHVCFALTPGLRSRGHWPKRAPRAPRPGATALQGRVAAPPPPQREEGGARSLPPCLRGRAAESAGPQRKLEEEEQQQQQGEEKEKKDARSLHPFLLAVNRGVVGGAVRTLDVLYPARASPWRRLWVLEVIARVPYFTFLCVNHFAETLGLGSERVTERLRAHFAEADNEALHLATMEALGGGELWVDQFVAQHVAIVYFWVGVVAYLVSPSLAYNFNELVELHAYKTYDKVLRENEFALRNEHPVPIIAHRYYTEEADPPRIIENMYDVIEAIRDDEANHATDLNRYSRESIGDVPWRG